MTHNYYTRMLNDLSERSRRAVISRLGFTNKPLREYLDDLFSRDYGERGSFLGDPAFEATFGWKESEGSLATLRETLLSHHTLDALSSHAIDKDHRFPLERKPYTHQLKAWQVLTQKTAQSLVVSSGTGSGKTECFMIPILDDLAREQATIGSQLIGVRALFLYPLNALINSQRDRLRAWTQHFNGDIRFCLYNGNTEEKQAAFERRKTPNEIIDREQLRDAPSPILVTNATMLEYMLIRNKDAPILQRSQGKLRWLVLDEAHTYIGSQAAELAMLIRRVCLAFGVQAKDVRFVATSATIGDASGKANQQLRRFLADVAGVDERDVHLVTGERYIPPMPSDVLATPASYSTLAAIEQETDRYHALMHDQQARRIRRLFADTTPPVARLSELCKRLGCQQQQGLQWLDLLSGTRDAEKKAFLPLRAHIFHQTLSGLWACCDSACSEIKNTVLDDEAWPFGQVYTEPRKHCACGVPAYEIVSCDDCGSVYLLAASSGGYLLHWQQPNIIDEFALEDDVSDDDQEDEPDDQYDERQLKGNQNQVLIVNRQGLNHTGIKDVHRLTRRIDETGDDQVRLIAQDDKGGLQCPFCDVKAQSKQKLFRFSRIGAPFLLGNILPTLLEFAPDGEKPMDSTYRGRRLLSFNDSRQGTARMAAKLQQDSERHRIRGLIYHLVLQHSQRVDHKEISELREKIQQGKNALQQNPPMRDFMENLITGWQKELDEKTAPQPMVFRTLVRRLADQKNDMRQMIQRYKNWSPATFNDSRGTQNLAEMMLIREFGRRPKRANNLESMGLVATCYPALAKVSNTRAEWEEAGLSLQDWQDFLKICLDFFVRAGGSLQINDDFRQWLGMPFPQTFLLAPDVAGRQGKKSRPWPQVKRGGMRSTLVRILAHNMHADINNKTDEDRVDVVLQQAWRILKDKVLQRNSDGWVLPTENLAFLPMDSAFICPVTRRFLDTTLGGVSPYAPQNTELHPSFYRCEKVSIPLYDQPFGGDITDEETRIARSREWLAKQPGIQSLRQDGHWISLNDRVIELAPYFTAAEHSAQQSSSQLEHYEKQFKRGTLNMLLCSTTMEMGIDIGGISVVTMNNVPPHPSNYLQRAGRAGRRNEARSTAVTLCRSNPHDQNVFANSRWAFDTILTVPRVSLDSAIIVQRHIHAYILNRFLSKIDSEATTLTCSWFFTPPEDSDKKTPVKRLIAWCDAFDPQKKEYRVIETQLKQLMYRSVLEYVSPARCLQTLMQALLNVESAWLQEWNSLCEQEMAIFEKKGEKDAACIAIGYQKKRVGGEYLLSELATRGFLPAYGFPTNIVSFDSITASQLKARKSHNLLQGREDNRSRRHEMASRDRALALREYAPGSEVVIDGLVYRSAGITLNWHIPADEKDVRETQAIRFTWRCRYCGSSGSSATRHECQQCPECGHEIKSIQRFIIPAGFSVDFYVDPDNDLTQQSFVPVEPAYISTKGDWSPLCNPKLGQFRYSDQGHMYVQSLGERGLGYAICLVCGRTEAIQKKATSRWN